MRKISVILALCLCLAMLASAALADGYTFPLEKTESFTALTNYPVGTEADPNNRTIFKRLEEATNVHVEWRTIQSDQWGDKITLEMSNPKTLPELVFNAGFDTNSLLKYAKQGAIIPLEKYIDSCMPNLQKVFEQAPEYRVMCTVLIAFRDNADALKAEFNIDGSIIPMSCIMNDGDQDPAILINGFGEGYGDPDRGRHIAVTNDKQVISVATTEGFKKGIAWLHELYAEGLIDPEAFTQEWSTYVAKGKSGRYGVLFSWDVANIAQVSMDDLIAGKGWVPLPALTADVRNITPQNGSYTSGFDRGRCVVTATCKNPELVCAWIDQMYDPIQSPQNNWGTYGEDDEFDIFEMSTNDAGEPMLKHTWLGDASPVEVREAESVNGPLAILDTYYNKYVTLPDDAAYRLNWIKDVYTPDMTHDYVYPNVFMNADDIKEISNLEADLTKCVNTAKSDWVMNGFTDADWDQFQNDLKAYGLDRYLEIHQKYLDAYFAG